jgi:hypothetical protein
MLSAKKTNHVARPSYWAAALLYFGSLPALSSPIYSSGAPDQRAAYYSPGFRYTESDMSFVLQPSASTIAEVQWWGIYGNASGGVPSIDDFVINIRRDAGGVPDTIPIAMIAVGNATRAATGAQLVGFDGNFAEYSYVASLSPITLTAGVTYWLGINNNINQWA